MNFSLQGLEMAAALFEQDFKEPLKQNTMVFQTRFQGFAWVLLNDPITDKIESNSAK